MDPLTAWVFIVIIVAVGLIYYRQPHCPECGSHAIAPPGAFERVDPTVRLCGRCGCWYTIR